MPELCPVCKGDRDKPGESEGLICGNSFHPKQQRDESRVIVLRVIRMEGPKWWVDDVLNRSYLQPKTVPMITTGKLEEIFRGEIKQ